MLHRCPSTVTQHPSGASSAHPPALLLKIAYSSLSSSLFSYVVARLSRPLTDILNWAFIHSTWQQRLTMWIYLLAKMWVSGQRRDDIVSTHSGGYPKWKQLVYRHHRGGVTNIQIHIGWPGRLVPLQQSLLNCRKNSKLVHLYFDVKRMSNRLLWSGDKIFTTSYPQVAGRFPLCLWGSILSFRRILLILVVI